MPRLSYREALAWLYGTQRFGIKLGLENIRKLLRELEASPRKSAYHSRCRHERQRLGLRDDRFHLPRTRISHRPLHLPSPRHVSRTHSGKWRNDLRRMRGAAGLTEIRDRIADWDPYPTFFEIATALGLKHLSTRNAEIIVLETGMGGRLDATNALQPSFSVITPIDLDHKHGSATRWKRSPRKKRESLSGKFRSSLPGKSRKQKKCFAGDLQNARRRFNSLTRRTKTHIALLGTYQQENAALAVAALRAAKIDVSSDAITRGLTDVEWPARFQIFDDQIVIDGAHNVAGARNARADMA